ncbi:hypothetical protein ARMSODRAFT_981858 [Armillaria solidipes]|uniref:Nephrocystin 3-like N-terminal domain-containing protein n=1 Tax=Armillaria solidipes TaxID=1076256 RepID=A0A2H3AQ79_9AGAR|nr:hypothetical protein ARMSODRAFT_981858 [Armillaria solidipes]
MAEEDAGQLGFGGSRFSRTRRTVRLACIQPCSSPPKVLGVASSVTTLIGNIVTLINYVKGVRNAPEEITQFLKELAPLEVYLTALRGLIQLSTEEGPWLKQGATNMKKNDMGSIKKFRALALDLPTSTPFEEVNAPGAAPDGLFKELEELLDGLKKKVNNDPPQWKMVKKRLLWTLTKTSVEDDLKKIKHFKTLVMSALQLNAMLSLVYSKLSHAIKDMLGDAKHTGEETLSIIKKKQMDEDTAAVVKWLTSDTVDYNDVQLEMLKKHVSNTGQWILKSPEFLSWVDGSGKSHTLRCQGGSGVGKTFLASIIINHLHSLPGIALDSLFEADTTLNIEASADDVKTNMASSPEIHKEVFKSYLC